MKVISSKEIEEILLHFSNSLLTLEDEDAILWDLVKNCIGILGFEDAVIYFVEGDWLVQKAALGPKNPAGTQILNALKISKGKGITGKVAETGLPMIIHDTRLHPEYIQDDEFRLSEIAVPILLEGKVIGVIDSENSEANFFSEQHLRILVAVASIYAGQIARIRAEKRVKEEQLARWKSQQKAARLQVEAISAQLSPHFVFNSLNAIQHYILQEDKRTSLRFLTIFGKLLRYFLTQLKQEAVKVTDEIQMLEWYLQLQKLRYGQKLTYQISEEGLAEFPNAQIPSIIVQSLIENLLEEQVYIAEGDLSIKVHFLINPESVTLKVLINNNLSGVSIKRYSDYLRSLTPWQDYVSLLNEIRPYQITSTEGEETCPDKKSACKSVSLTFPNLTI
ncbi:MAG: histidine kinase [Lewinellaceae bacterium]|nr:histidine kinase [Lewinellaceae bacterium]